MSDKPLSPKVELCNARTRLGWTQADLAERSGLSQTAISRFETGDYKAISKTRVLELCKVLGIDTNLLLPKAQVSNIARGILELHLCPSAECLLNVPTLIRENLVFTPTMIAVSPDNQDGGIRCPCCALPMENRCRECAAKIVEGSFCSKCGTAYVDSRSSVSRSELTLWVKDRQKEIRFLRETTRTIRRQGQVWINYEPENSG